MTARECGDVLTRVRNPGIRRSLADIPLVIERHVEYILHAVGKTAVLKSPVPFKIGSEVSYLNRKMIWMAADILFDPGAIHLILGGLYRRRNHRHGSPTPK